MSRDNPQWESMVEALSGMPGAYCVWQILGTRARAFDLECWMTPGAGLAIFQIWHRGGFSVWYESGELSISREIARLRGGLEVEPV